MSHLSVSEPSKEDANRVYETPERPDVKQKRKKKWNALLSLWVSGHLGRDPKCPVRGLQN